MTRRDVVRAAGPDAASYLQGQISQDIDALAAGETAWSFILAPTGKVDAWFRIHRVSDDDFLLDIDAGFADALIARLERFKLRTAVDFTLVADTDLPDPLAWPGVDDVDDERARIRGGFPRMGAELTVDTIPAEVGQRVIDRSVSFTKGCYTGQELVARINSRGGNVPRPVRLLTASDGSSLAVGDPVCVGDEQVGVVTSAAGDSALAPLLRKAEVGTEVAVGTVRARVSELGGS